MRGCIAQITHHEDTMDTTCASVGDLLQGIELVAMAGEDERPPDLKIRFFKGLHNCRVSPAYIRTGRHQFISPLWGSFADVSTRLVATHAEDQNHAHAAACTPRGGDQQSQRGGSKRKERRVSRTGTKCVGLPQST